MECSIINVKIIHHLIIISLAINIPINKKEPNDANTGGLFKKDLLNSGSDGWPELVPINQHPVFSPSSGMPTRELPSPGRSTA
jgi:hypothetical protein